MKDIFITFGWIAVISILVFIFDGKPSVFELLHTKAIEALK